MNEQIYLTAARLKELQEELTRKKDIERVELAQRLRSAIQEGDLSENADYHKAKEDQSFLEGRIQDLERIVGNAVLIDEARSRDVVDVGAKVTIQEEDFEPEMYQIVGAQEADPRKRKISNESPIGKSLMGKRAGEMAVAQTPNGELRLKVIKIE
jgi:transcription elongation factor GreA